ncbi:nickel pincer cofactor biosynthesis protein LarC [Salinarchaeum sp. IM2453]|uniref:nickel pincer cofactor biosynthesis protein LarC n=1 Tax=Salinarchaeum sp. IM2453 TaxID=2862870 RepID=UPI001C831EC3|nr:nickel pincer cofactor biosynthesis protein LarC [Salinarchaeum sp. IM2453]QZA88942.1 nickel pincer cofactor biosynthesis protein LarC [Salinarchaeum sp. IM2453]
MQTLAFDGRVGASGDMLLGTLLSLGADRDVLTAVEDELDVAYDIHTVTDCGIEAIGVDVRTSTGDHAEHNHHHHRTYTEVIDVVEEMDVPADVRSAAIEIFQILGEAEATVHGTTLDDIAFHEVGADDAIADIVGVALLLDDLDVTRVLTTPVAAGGGEVEMSHGVYPVPGPAVTKIAERATWEITTGPVDRELLTPTGAAILAYYADGVDTLPALDVSTTGYGAGDHDLSPRPNVLRGLLGQSDQTLRSDTIRVLETNVDDVSPEVLGSLQETLIDAGARDVSIIPTTMKKSRPGHLIKVIVKPEDVPTVTETLATETGTLGIRDAGVTHRWIADREYETVTLPVGDDDYDITVKIARDQSGTVYDVSAEYDDALAVARETNLSLRSIMQRAESTVNEE